VRKIAIANPEHAPYGRAAVAALQKLGLYESVKDRLVYAENVAQTAQVIESGAADIGIIALSLAVAPALKGKGRYWEIPLAAYPRMEQGGVILSWARHPNAARELRDYIMAPPGQAVLRRYGFSLPGQ
jgi:molybdate transport system substrate-binding protein